MLFGQEVRGSFHNGDIDNIKDRLKFLKSKGVCALVLNIGDVVLLCVACWFLVPSSLSPGISKDYNWPYHGNINDLPADTVCQERRDDDLGLKMAWVVLSRTTYYTFSGCE